jgi:O-antigen/teichoic acid export membrane protein
LGLLLSALQAILATVLIAAILIRSGVPLTLEQGLLSGIYAGALVIAYLFVSGLYGIGRNEEAAVVQVGGAAVQLILVIVLATVWVATPWPYVVAILLGTIGQILASVIVLRSAGFLPRPQVSIEAWRRLIARGVPAVGLSLGQAAVLRLDRVLVGLLLSAAAVGVYSVAATATDVVALVPVALSQVLFQKIASKSVDSPTLNRARAYALLSSAAIAVVLYLLAPVGIDLLVGSSFAGAVLPLRILLLAAVVFSSYQIDAYALAARGQIGIAGSATLLGLVVIVIADLILIPTHGIVGAAWASVFAYAIMAASVRVLMRRGGGASANTAGA